MPSQFPLLFLQACISSIVVGAAAWALLRLASRIWPGLAAQRAPWLLAKLAAGAVLILVLLPGATRFSILPAVELSAAPPAQLAADHAADFAGTDDIGLATAQPVQTLAWLGDAWLLIYAAGFIHACVRSWRGRRVLAALMKAAQRLSPVDIARHPALAARRNRLPLSVLEVDAPIPPMLTGLLQPTLLLPRHLRALDLDQQTHVIEHELTHLSRLDQLWLHMALGLQILLWFNPALPALRRQLTWAQELGCDRMVLAGCTPQQRKSYAEALIAQFKMQQASPTYAAMAFGGQLRDSVTARVMLIRDGVPLMNRAAVRATSVGMLAALLLASVALQPAFALRTENAPALPATVATDAPPQWRAPLQRMHVTSHFGKPRPGSTPHGGIDLVAKTGTPIMATAAGTVSASTDLYEGNPKYGEVIAIEHADGLRSVYAHLQQRSVKVGDVVTQGQLIGLTGATGRVTGPHLHLEVHRNSEKLDPVLLLGGLAGTEHTQGAHAVPRAR